MVSYGISPLLMGEFVLLHSLLLGTSRFFLSFIRWSFEAHPTHVDWYCCSGPPNVLVDGPLAGLDECAVIKGLMFQLKVDDSQSIDGWHSEWHHYRVSTEPGYLRALIVSLANGVARNARVNVYLLCT